MSFLWPTELNPNIGVLGRFGRILHWIGVVVGLLMAVYVYTQTRNSYNSETVVFAVMIVGFPMLLGRGARYIFAGE